MFASISAMRFQGLIDPVAGKCRNQSIGVLATRQTPHEIQIAVEKVVAGQTRMARPLELLKYNIRRDTAEFSHSKKNQQNRVPARIGMLVPDHLFADLSADIEFLAQFARKRGTRLLAVFDFASGKLPLQGVTRASLALADKNPALLLDDGGDDDQTRFLCVECYV